MGVTSGSTGYVRSLDSLSSGDRLDDLDRGESGKSGCGGPHQLSLAMTVSLGDPRGLWDVSDPDPELELALD